LNFEVTATLSVQYGYAFVFQGRAINPSLSTTQFRGSVVPGGHVSAHVSAAIDIWIASGSISADVTLIDLSFPATVAAQLDGSTACYGVDVDSTFLSGEVVLRYKAPCIWRCSTKTKQLFSWTAFRYRTNLVKKSCCGSGARGEADDVMMTNELPSLHYQRTYTFQDGDPVPGTHPINNGKTMVVWKKENGVARVKSAETHVSFNAKQGRITDAVKSDPSEDVKAYLKRSDQRTAAYSAGHILAASLGGSNIDKYNFFIQLEPDNRGSFNTFEEDIARCLTANHFYSVKYVMLFEYDPDDDIKPRYYTAQAAFYIGPADAEDFPNRFLLAQTQGFDKGWRPLGCPYINLANIGIGKFHMSRTWSN